MAAAKASATKAVGCTNCTEKAQYQLGDPNNVVYYCARCLPRHFAKDADEGRYPVTA